MKIEDIMRDFDGDFRSASSKLVEELRIQNALKVLELMRDVPNGITPDEYTKNLGIIYKIYFGKN